MSVIPHNRKLALQYHGYNCAACGFNYESTYGVLGSKYIEVHHIKPLHFINEEIDINPKTDLIPLCANCHRMIHRLINENKTDIHSVTELKKIVSYNRNK